MTLEAKLRNAAVMAAVEISMKHMGRSPERCARNLMQLVTTAYPNKLPQKERADFLSSLLSICKENDMKEARALFIRTFLTDSV